MVGQLGGHLPTEATLSHLLIREGFLPAADAIAWADGWMLRLDSVPDELIRISLSRGDPNEILSALGRLALPRLSEQAFGQLCGLLLARLEAEAGALSAVNSALYHLHWDDYHGARPLDFPPTTPLNWFQEQEELVTAGYVQMTMDELRQEVMTFLQSYAAASPAHQLPQP